MRTLEHTLTHEESPSSGKDAARPYLFCVLKCDELPASVARYPLGKCDEVHFGRGKTFAWQRPSARRLDLKIADGWMSTAHAVLRRAGPVWQLADAGSKNGTLLNGERVEAPTTVNEGDWIELGHTFYQLRRQAGAADDEAPLELPAVRAVAPENALLTLSPRFARELAALLEIARSQVPVLLGGETGTGKEVITRAIHAHSGRRGKLVAVNCGAIPDTLVESTLFGHKRGAFSGATQDRVGLVAAAQGGTLLLDEIADLPLPAQAALLRVLQEKEVVPVGATEPEKVDFRLVAATHHDLAKRVAGGEFREDLFNRIAGFTLTLPPLRERREDLGLIMGALLCAQGHAQVQLSVEASRALLGHDWPGNVRELERTLAAAVVLAKGGRVQLEHLPAELRETRKSEERAARVDEAVLGAPPDPEAQKQRLIELLAEHQGNVSAVARALRTSRSQVHRWAKRYGIELSKDAKDSKDKSSED